MLTTPVEDMVCRLNKTVFSLFPLCSDYVTPFPLSARLKMQMLSESFCDFVALSVQLLVSGDLHTDKIDQQQEEENSRCQGN